MTSIPVSLNTGRRFLTLSGDAPSTLNLILPELYLGQDGVEKRIDAIHDSMDKYLDDGIFTEYKNAMVYVERTQSNGILRQGIVGAVDLEQYDFSKGSSSQWPALLRLL